jgi:toluene monooxygenase system protein A
MSLAPGEIGDDAHQYAWVEAWRERRAADQKKAA